MKRHKIAAVVYALAATATFSWSASDPEKVCKSEDMYCLEDVDQAFPAIVAGIFWPFYWAWTAADELRGRS